MRRHHPSKKHQWTLMNFIIGRRSKRPRTSNTTIILFRFSARASFVAAKLLAPHPEYRLHTEGGVQHRRPPSPTLAAPAYDSTSAVRLQHRSER